MGKKAKRKINKEEGQEICFSNFAQETKEKIYKSAETSGGKKAVVYLW